MSEPIQLKGMTWDHPRAFLPLEAAAAYWREHGVEIHWERRSLQDFESFPVDELAARYDLIVIDHPHVGIVADQRCLAPLDEGADKTACMELERASVGQSFASYRWKGQQWALPIDAATQVQAWRPDRLNQAPQRWEDVMQLAAKGLVLCPLRAPHALMSLFTLCGLLGADLNIAGPDLFPVETGIHAFAMLQKLAASVDERCFSMDPISVLDAMSGDDTDIVLAPLIYGYVNYSMPDFTPHPLNFGDLPTVAGPITGSALGGTGIAVSSRRPHIDASKSVAFFLAGQEFQCGAYAMSGGQAGHAAAWEDDGVNKATRDFYRNTRRTLESAWVRPRHSGYLKFQEEASRRVEIALRKKMEGQTIIGELNRMFAASL